MAEIRNSFLKGSMNKDLDERLIPDGQYVDAVNIDVEATEGRDSGAAKNKLGNTLIGDLSIVSGRNTSTARTIGAIEYESLERIYWFVSCDTFDGIYEYDAAANVTTRVLQANKALPTTITVLNFRKEYAITGVNYIAGPDGQSYLYWTDDYNPPRRINIARAKSYAVDDVRIADDINVIIEPPLYAPSIDTYEDKTIDNADNMSEKFLYFSYRYKYVDDQYSSMSPFSAVAFAPKSYEYDYGVGNNKSMTNKFNSVRVTVETGNQFVKEIQILVKDTRDINVSIIDSYSKDKLQIANDVSYTITFNTNKIYAALPTDQLTRLYDNVPLLAKAQDVVGNRLSYGNYVQFRDIVDSNNKNIFIDYSLSLLQEGASETRPRPTWRSDRDYEVGLVYLDKYGRMTTVLNTVNPIYNSIYVPPTNSNTANSIQLTIRNIPPSWATHYRVYVKQAKKAYYNVFPIISYNEGLFKYFLINDSDLNKIRVGEYVIFKSTSAGPTLVNKKYKILEIEQKASNFVSGAIAGLYFKIKIDFPNELSGSGIQQYTSQGVGGTNVFAVGLPVKKSVDYFSSSSPPTVGANIGGGWVENPIFYGLGDPSGISLFYSSINCPYNNPDNEDTRITIQIESPTTYSVYKNSISIYSLSNSNVVVEFNQPIIPNTPTSIAFGYFDVVFNQSSYAVGDRWVFNCRYGDLKQEFGGNLVSGTNSVAIIPGANWSEVTPEVDRKILTGAIIKIQVLEELYNDGTSFNQNTQNVIEFSPSPQDYENIEEWWYESGARDQFLYTDVGGNQKKGSRVRFRRGKNFGLYNSGGLSDFDTNSIEYNVNNLTASTDPVRMLIFSSVPNNPGNNGSYAASLYNDGVSIGQIAGYLLGVFGGLVLSDKRQSKFVVKFDITQQENLNICETVPIEEDAEIYHETFQTYPIEGGYHKVLWRYSDYEFYPATGQTRLRQFDKAIPHYFNVGDIVDVNTTLPAINGTFTISAIEDAYSIVLQLPFPGAGPITPGTVTATGSLEFDQSVSQPAVIKINKPNIINTEFNSWCWGNGLESDRIYDDFNETRKDLSPRVQVPIEDYKQVRNEAALCYSGVYRDNSSLNRLNEFNLSLANFKYLDRDFGSIQKLYATDTNLYVFQENKVSQVLYGKNILFDSIGGGQVVSIPEVLGNQIPMIGEWGISKHPESFAKWGPDIFFADQRRGVVLQMFGEQILEISSLGMTDHFRDLMVAFPNTQKLGAYDPHNNMYVLSSNDQRSIPCVLTISPNKKSIPNTGPSSYFLFTITTNEAWTITLVNQGFGTAWVTNYPASGVGSQDIYAVIGANNSNVNRSIGFLVTYCGGLSVLFTLTQARGKNGKPVAFIFSNIDPRKTFNSKYQQ